jgi:hypothetical protein
MANEIRTKLDAAAAATITLASLASNSARQSTKITNTNARPGALIYFQVRTGATPVDGGTVELYLLKGDGTIAEDNYGASDAAITLDQAKLLGVIRVSATGNAFYRAAFDTGILGPLGSEFVLAVQNLSGFALHATAGDHALRHTLYVPEVQ